jgi:hypothetical protein
MRVLVFSSKMMLFYIVVDSIIKRSVCFCGVRGVLDNCLNSFADGMFGKLSGQYQSDCCLDCARGEGFLLADGGDVDCLCGHSLEGVVDEAVQDLHRVLGDAHIRMDLLSYSEDITRQGRALSLSLLLSRTL